jgi:hypothetical protein
MTLHPAPITVKYSKCAYARLQTYVMSSGIPMAELVRSLVKIGWAVMNDGADIDMPIGSGIKLAHGTPGANGAADLPAAHEVAA